MIVPQVPTSDSNSHSQVILITQNL